MNTLTREQIREIDRRAIEDYGIPGLVLMENAGRNAAQVIIDRSGTVRRPPVCMWCGRGNNGGDGFVIARHLRNAQFPVEIILIGDPHTLTHDAAVNCGIARKMSIPTHAFEPAHSTALTGQSKIMVDALLGTGFSGQVRSPLDQAIRIINAAANAMCVAVDVPSGLDCNTGRPAETTVKADLTITFVASKTGFPRAAEYTGEVLVVDIGAPRALLDHP